MRTIRVLFIRPVNQVLGVICGSLVVLATHCAIAQYDTNAGIVMSVPLSLNLTEGNRNTITIASVGNGKPSFFPIALTWFLFVLELAGDLDYIVVY